MAGRTREAGERDKYGDEKRLTAAATPPQPAGIAALAGPWAVPGS
jgi:hypothetical protein